MPTVPLMRMTDVLADYLAFELPSVHVPVYFREFTRSK